MAHVRRDLVDHEAFGGLLDERLELGVIAPVGFGDDRHSHYVGPDSGTYVRLHPVVFLLHPMPRFAISVERSGPEPGGVDGEVLLHVRYGQRVQGDEAVQYRSHVLAVEQL